MFQTQEPFDYVIHTASPYKLHVKDVVKEVLGPAIRGTLELLTAVKAHAPTVKRVVITSSSAAILNPEKHAHVYDETHWAPPWGSEEAVMNPENYGYIASKVSKLDDSLTSRMPCYAEKRE